MKTIKSGTSVKIAVYESIKSSIMKAELKPGQKLSEVELGKQLDVSRTPVREAFIRLAQEGLLTIYPQRGTVVSKINRKDVIEAQFIRESLEVSVLKLLAQKITKKQIEILQGIIEKQHLSYQSKSYMDFYTLDESFHETISVMSGHGKVWDVIKEVKVPMDRIRMLSLPIPTKIELMISQHEEIVKTLATRNIEEVEEKIRIHLNEVFYSITDLSEKYADYFI